MRRSLVVLVAVVLAVFAGSTPAFAADTTQIVKDLKLSHVYVESGTPSTDQSTKATIRQQFNEGDNILIVMLSEKLTNDAAEQLARQIDAATGKTAVIGMYYDGGTLGYSSYYSNADVNQQMVSATTVSTTPTETMVTFIQNIQQYVSSQPKPVKPVPSKAGSGNQHSLLVIPISFAAAILILLIAFVIVRSRRPKRYTKGVTPASAPRDLRPLIHDLRNIRREIDDRSMAKSIDNICTYTEAYFERTNARGAERERDTKTFERHLKNIKSVLVLYLDVHANPDFYTDVNLADAQDAVDGFAAFVLNQIRRGSSQSLADFRVNTKILSASKYSS